MEVYNNLATTLSEQCGVIMVGTHFMFLELGDVLRGCACQ